MKYQRLSLSFMIIELFTAITKYGIYTFPFYGLYTGVEFSWEPILVGTYIFQVLFLLFPLIAVVLMLRGNNLAFLFAAAFPVVAFLFGVVPIPFASYLYRADIQINTIFIGVINAASVFMCWWLYRKITRSNKSN